MQTLKRFGTVSRNERGIVLTLPETFWSGARLSSFAPNTDVKLSTLGEVLSSNMDYKIIVEAHTDNKGTPEELQTLTQERAQALVDKMSSLGVAQNRFEAKGFGASLPIVANTTNANRAKNRRVQLILVPNYDSNNFQ
jgi:outer membrane protein OmpA-like peptidoglycan-associated protein